MVSFGDGSVPDERTSSLVKAKTERCHKGKEIVFYAILELFVCVGLM